MFLGWDDEDLDSILRTHEKSPGMVGHLCRHSTGEAETGISMRFTVQVA